MAQFTKYTSSDAGAPQLTGVAGSLIAVLDAVLINGYGSKVAAGWSRPVATGTNIAAYKQGSGAKAKASFVLNDAGITGFNNTAAITGWRAVTATTGVGVGSGQFPLPAQQLSTGRGNIRKSATSAAADVRSWCIYADDRTFYLFNRAGNTYLGQECAWSTGFGEFYSYAPNDLGNCFLAALNINSPSDSLSSNGGLDICAWAGGTAPTGCWFMDNISGSNGSNRLYPVSDPGKQQAITNSLNYPNVGLGPCPNPADGAIYVVPIQLMEGQGSVRGRYRGLYALMHPLGATSDGAVFQGAGALAGKTFTVVAPTNAISNLLVETSNTLDTNV